MMITYLCSSGKTVVVLKHHLPVRIDGKDYIFGQDYGWFGIDSKLYEPVVDYVNRTVITKWVIKGVEVTQKLPYPAIGIMIYVAMRVSAMK